MGSTLNNIVNLLSRNIANIWITFSVEVLLKKLYEKYNSSRCERHHINVSQGMTFIRINCAISIFWVETLTLLQNSAQLLENTCSFTWMLSLQNIKYEIHYFSEKKNIRLTLWLYWILDILRGSFAVSYRCFPVTGHRLFTDYVVLSRGTGRVCWGQTIGLVFVRLRRIVRRRTDEA